MKHLKLAVASSVLLLSGAVCAMDFDPKFYVGAEAGINQLKMKNKDDDFSVKSTKPSGAALVGVRLIENLGLELGYTAFGAFKDKDVNADRSLSFKLRSPHADVVGYLPVSSDFDLIAALGMGRVTGKVKGTQISTGTALFEPKLKATALRVGLGVQYKFDEHLSARVMLRHQRLRSIKFNDTVIKSLKVHVNSAALGLFYQF